MRVAVARYHTVAEIARNLGVMRHRVVFVLLAYHVPHAVEVGDAKGYDDRALEMVRDHLARIDSARLAAR